MSENQQDESLLGKKVFFLNPPSVIQDEMISDILKNEYEVYMVRDANRTVRLMNKYPDSILFVNIDHNVKETNWEVWIRALMDDPATKNVRVGILTYNKDQALAEKYLMDMMVPCGFIKLTLGLAESTEILLKALEANEAKGRRKFVRALIPDNTPAPFNVVIQGQTHTGKVIDISAVGMACLFDKYVNLKAHSVLESMQLRLKGSLCMVNGIVMGTRNEHGQLVYIIMFDPKMHADTRSKIRTFIFSTQQAIMDSET